MTTSVEIPTLFLPHFKSAFTLVLATSEPCQTGLVSFSKADISRITDTWQVPVVLLISAFENETKPVWHGSEVASVNTLYVSSRSHLIQKSFV